MKSPTELQPQPMPNKLRLVSTVAAAYVLIGGAVSMAGWIAPMPRLTDWDGTGITIKFNTAVTLTAGALALLALLLPWLRWIAGILGFVVMLVGIAMLSQHILGYDLGIDQYFFTEPTGAAATASPGRMGPPAATSFTMLGLAFVMATVAAWRRYSFAPALVAFAISSVSLIGYLFGASQLFTGARTTGIAFQTASMIAVLAVGVLTAIPEYGPVSDIVRKDGGGAMLRRLLPTLTAIAILLGFLRVLAQDVGIVDTALGTAIRTLVEIFLFWLLLWSVARSVSKNESAEARLGAIVASSDDAIVSKDLNGVITSWNLGAERLFGYKADEAVGQPVTLLIPEDHLDEEPKILDRIRRGESVEHYETVRRRKDGTLLNISLTVSPIRDAAGTVIGASKIARDITDRAESEAALRAKDAELQMIADTTPLVLARCGRDLTYKFINKSGAALFGLTPEQIVGRPILEVMGKKAFAAIQPYVRTVLRGEPVEFESEITYPIGPRWMRVNYEPERDPAGKVVGWLASIVDVTEIRAAQHARREIEERFSRFMGNLPGLAWIKDLEGRYVYANDAAVHAFGTRREELYARTDEEVFPPEIAAAFKANDKRALARGEAVEAVETLTQPDGTHHSLVTKFPIVGPDGETAAIGGMAIDITERVRGEERLRRSQERFILAQQAGGVGIWDWDIVRGKTYWSETTWAFYGELPGSFDPDEAFWSEHIHEEDRTRVMLRLQDALDSGGDRYWDEFRIARPDGSVLWIETSGTIVRDETGQPTRVYGVNLDITRRREGEEALKRAHDELEVRVAERTKELAEANALLLKQMDEQARAERQRIRLLKKIVTIQEDERGRIARDLHDQLGQRFTALRLKIASLSDLAEGDGLMKQRVLRLQEISEGLDNEISHLAWQLRPAVLEDAGLVAALEQHVAEWSRRYGIPTEFSAFGLRDNVIAPDIETNLYRITQEALNNVAKHSQASRAAVLLERRANELILIVEDDGVGFDASKVDEGASGKGFGLGSMRDRTGVIAGTLEIESGNGNGATIFVRVPVE